MAAVHLAGLALVKPGKILLVHPTGALYDGTWSIPKGHQEPGEPSLDAAVREVEEETGIVIPRTALQGMPRILEADRKRVMFYWRINAKWLPIPDVIPQNRLQAEEVDEARFVPLLEAEMLIVPWQLPVLNEASASSFGWMTR